MGSSILSEVDDTSILRTRLSTCYWLPLNWPRPLGSCPRAAGWSAATLCFGPSRHFAAARQFGRYRDWSGHWTGLVSTSLAAERNRLHLDRLVEEHVGVVLGDVERFLDPDVGLDELVALLHPLRIEPAEPRRLRRLIAHQLFDLVPVDQLVGGLQAGIGLDQRLHARGWIGNAGSERLLRHFDERGDRGAMRAQESAVDDDRIAVGD